MEGIYRTFAVIEKVILELQFILFAVMTEDKAFMLKSNFISSHTLFVELNRMSLPPSYCCLGHRPGRQPGQRLVQRFGHRSSQLPIIPYVYREAIEPHSIRQSSHILDRPFNMIS